MTSPPSEADSKAVAEASASGAELAVVAGVTRASRTNVAVYVLAVIAFVVALYFARAFVVPLLIGILASYTPHPMVDRLKALHVPRPVSAALVLVVLVGS
jgi:predicted PurR-regulated permease PerM